MRQREPGPDGPGSCKGSLGQHPCRLLFGVRRVRALPSRGGAIKANIEWLHIGAHRQQGSPSCTAADCASGRGLAIATRDVTGDERAMRIRHKGLRALAEQDRRRQLPGDLVPELRRVLTLLDEGRNPRDLAAQPCYRLHPLKADMGGLWSIRVSGNWRVVFRFEDNEAEDVDLVDYH